MTLSILLIIGVVTCLLYIGVQLVLADKLIKNMQANIDVGHRNHESLRKCLEKNVSIWNGNIAEFEDRLQALEKPKSKAKPKTKAKKK